MNKIPPMPSRGAATGEASWAAGLLAVSLAVAVVLVVGIPLLLYYAFVVSTLWGWFAVPAFGVEKVGVLGTAGLISIVSVLRQYGSSGAPERNGKDGPLAHLTIRLSAPLISLGIGWIILQFL